MSSLQLTKRASSQSNISETSSPMFNPVTKGQPAIGTRKRKCPLKPKQIDEDDELEIIAVEESKSFRINPNSSCDDACDSGITLDITSSSPISSLSPPGKRVALGPRNDGGNNIRRSSINSNFNQGKNVQRTELSSPIYPTPSIYGVTRTSPLPHFNWADAKEVWELMVKKDDAYQRDADMMSRHSSLQPRMRSILLDWLSEVCEVYKLHRETFYLAVDFIDRYLSAVSEVPKQELQLIGITCLFIAAKSEEIYPPKLTEFAYVTDGACCEEDIIDKELDILKSLKWNLVPMTPNGWLCVYMQLYSSIDQKENSSPVRTGHQSEQRDFMIPGYPSQFFAQVAHLLDLAILDIGSLNFFNSVMAAAALYHFTNEEVVFQCTGLKLPQIRDCVLWMTPFALAIRDEGFENPKLFKSSDSSEAMHNIQSHTADLNLLEKAHIKQAEQEGPTIGVVDESPRVSGSVLTPPKSVQKK